MSEITVSEAIRLYSGPHKEDPSSYCREQAVKWVQSLGLTVVPDPPPPDPLAWLPENLPCLSRNYQIETIGHYKYNGDNLRTFIRNSPALARAALFVVNCINEAGLSCKPRGYTDLVDALSDCGIEVDE